MSPENIEIANQLKSIKRWIAVGAIGFLLIGVGVALFSVSMSQMVSEFEDEYSEESCEKEEELTWDNASDLFEQGKTEELMRLVDNRLVTHPNDPTAHWFKSKVYYLNKEWSLALESIEKTEVLAPNWRQEYTKPLREKIEELRK